jgi:hypothetical protein
LEGKQHPDRDEQFNHINKEVKKALKSGNPVVSVDSKCKEYLGYFYRKGQTWCLVGCPIEVKDHDFPIGQDQIMPFSIYDKFRNTGYINLGFRS